MTPERLKKLIADGEALNVEFKGESGEQLNDRDLVEAVVCLANRSGEEPGWLLIGVEDDGEITGAQQRHGNVTDPTRLQALIANKTRPSVAVRAEPVEVRGKTVLVVQVPPSTSPVGTSGGKYLRRTIAGDGNPACRPMEFHEMQALLASRRQLDYTALEAEGVTWDDLDPLEFERFRRLVRESRHRGDETLLDLTDRELAKALGAIEANHDVDRVSILGLLLCGKEEALRRYLPTHEVAFQALDRHGHVEVNDFFRWPLLRTMEELQTRYRAHVREEELMVGMLRVAVPDYSERAFREAVANALVHRDYTRQGAVHVQWTPQRLQISNPGGFPEGVRLDNLLVTPPRPRNPLLADAFKRAGLVERTARGIDTIFHEQLRNGRPAPSYEQSSETDVVLTLPGGESNLGFVRLVTEENRAGRDLSLDELLILNLLWLERRIRIQQASETIQKPAGEARAVLQGLVERGLVEAQGEGRGRSYHLSAAIYRRLGDKAAYVRQKGFDPLQQEQMVLSYIDTHGSISRREAAGLCQLSRSQAYRLLKRLEEAEHIRKTAARGRNVRYVRTEEAESTE